MAKQLLQCIEGTHDYLDENGRRFALVMEAAGEVFERYAFAKITTPIFEPTELFARGIGTTTDIVEKEMYTFAPGSDSLTLRPEGTAGVIRAYLQHNLHKIGGLHKMWYAGPMFRRERPQKGRQRQFHQVGVEAVGSSDPLLDAEVISMGLAVFRQLGINGVKTRLNSIGCPNCRPAYREALKAAVEPLLPNLCKSCQSRYERNPLRIVDCKACAALTRELPAAYDYLCPECAAHFTAVKDALTALGVEYDIDKTLVRGLDYYTKTVFEFTHSGLGAQDALGGGGRYDGLVRELGDVDMPAVGFAMGVERIMIVLEGLGLTPAAPRLAAFGVALGDAARARMLPLLASIRAAGLRADMDFGARSMKAQMRAANNRGALAALILGDSELEKGVIVVKDLREGGTQKEVKLEDVTGNLCDLIIARPQ